MKKKFTMLFAALSLMTAASAQVITVSNAPADGNWDENTTWYLIRNKKGGYVSPADGYVNNDGYLQLNNTAKPAGDDALWCVVGNETDGYKFYNKGAGVDKILGATGTLNSGDPSMLMNDASAPTSAVTLFDIAASQKSGYLVVKDHGSASNYWNHRGGNLAYWNSGLATNDDGSSFVFETEAQLADAIAALNASLTEANTMLTESELEYASTAITLQVTEQTEAGYISCNNIDPDEGSDMNNLIDNNPSTFIHTNWHNVSSTKDYLDIYLGEGKGVSLLQFSEITRSDATNDFPASIEILGRTTENEEYTTVTTVSGLPTTPGASYTSPAIECDPSYIYLRFIVTGSTYAANRPYWHMAEFDLYSLELTINEEYKVAMDEYIALYEGIGAIQSVADDANADVVQLGAANATLQSYLLAIDEVFNPERYALEGRIEELSAYLAWGGTAVGYYPVEKINTLSAAIDEAQAVFDAAESVADDYATALTTLNNTFSGLDLVNSAYMPESDKYYTIRNAYSGIRINVSATGGLISTNDGIGIGEVFQFVPAEGGKFYLKNVERGTLLSTAPVHGGGQVSAAVTAEGDAKPVAVASLGFENRVSITPEGGTTVHHDAGQGTIVGWNGDANSRSAWKIEEVDITGKAHKVSISDVEWATLVLGYDAVIPAGVTAYAVTSTNATHAVLTEVTGTIPAYAAVLLNGEAGEYRFEVTTEAANEVADNKLVGTTINTYVADNAYVLSMPTIDEVVQPLGLYKAALNKGEAGAEGTTHFLNNAFKAYLVVEGAEAPMFRITRGDAEDTTGIEQLAGDNAEVVIYDLAGRRVAKMEKGIYIVNGKKVIVK